jgi:hypothetical protein
MKKKPPIQRFEAIGQCIFAQLAVKSCRDLVIVVVGFL